MNAGPGITIVQVAAGIAVLVLVVALLLPALRPNRHPRTLQQNASQVRGILQSLVSFAEINKGRYPGIGRPDFDGNGWTDVDWTTDGEFNVDRQGHDVEARYYELLSRNLFTGELIVSPWENKTIWTTDAMTTENYSYAMLDIDVEGERKNEWRNTINSEAIMISDRNIGTPGSPQSISSQHGKPLWAAGFNDGHVEMQYTPIWLTKYGMVENKDDNIFTATGDDDAYMIYEGQ